MIGRWSLVLAIAAGLALAGCAAPAPSGVILVSLPGVRADALGSYGAVPSPTPFLDRLAAEGVRFDRAFAPSPSSLASHLSLVTGLEPPEHGVRPPLEALSSRIPTLAERFSQAGFRTAGFTDDGFISRAFGLDRGFDRFVDPPPGGPGAPTPFDRATAFLRELEPADRFLLVVHSRAASPPSAAQAPARDAYLSELSQLDSQLEGLLGELRRLGRADQTVVAVTADHGLELGEHGSRGHHQLYPETLRVPLLLIDPRRPGGRVASGIARLVDVTATLYDLAAVPPPSRITGRSLASEGVSEPPQTPRAAYAESHGWTPQRSLVVQHQGRTLQLVESAVLSEPDGAWISRSVRFDATGPEVAFRIVSYAQSRAVTITVNGGTPVVRGVGRRWSPVRMPLPAGRNRVEIATDDCTSPSSLGNGNDPRCLSFKLQGLELRRTELFDLDRDPGAARDLSATQPEITHHLARLLSGLTFRRLAMPERLRPAAPVTDALAALGYLDGSSPIR